MFSPSSRLTLENSQYLSKRPSQRQERSSYQQPVGKRKTQNENELKEQIEEFNLDERQKLQDLIGKISKMKDEQRAHDLVKNLPTRMLKSFDENKFALLNDISYFYNKETFLDSIQNNSKRKSQLNIQNNLIQENKNSKNLASKEAINVQDNQDKMDDKSTINKSQIVEKQNKSFNQFFNKYKYVILKNICIKIVDSIPIIQPSDPYKLIWDLVNMIIIILCMFYLPVTIVFNFDFSELISKELLVIIPNFLVLDILININTGYFQKGQVVKNRSKIIYKYCQKNILTDIISVFPFITLLYHELVLTTQHSETNSSVNNYPKVLLLAFFLKGLSLSSNLKKIEERFNLPRILTNIIQLGKLLFTIILINHLFACLWVYAARVQIESGNNQTWMSYGGIQYSHWTKQYLAAFYFTTVTMITVGYGDILPKTDIEYILCIITMMLACGVFGYSLNEVGSIFSNFFQVDNEIKQKLSLIQRFMSKKSINSKLQFKVREYLEYYWRESAEADQEQEQNIIEQLSESLRQKLLFEANKIVLRDSPIFKHNFSKNVIEQTVPLIQEIKYSPESLICEKNMQDDCAIYFIENGSVDIVLNTKQKNPTVLFTLNKGDTFGAHTFFTGLQRMNNVRSNEFTTVLKIRRQDFIQLISEYPEDYETFCNIRDQISYLNDYSKIGLKCKSCKSNYHMVNDCQCLHYISNKAKIIKRFHDFNNIGHNLRVQFKRRSENQHYYYKNSRKVFCEVIRQIQLFMEHNESLLNISDDESEYSDGYYNSDTESYQESKSEQEQNETEKEPIESEKDLNKTEISKRKIFTRMNSAKKFELDQRPTSSKNIMHDDKVQDRFTKQNSYAQEELEQYFYFEQNISISDQGHGQKKKIDKQSHNGIRNKLDKSENISENSTQINTISQDNKIFNFPSSNRDRSTTSAETAPIKIDHHDNFKQSKTSVIVSNYDKSSHVQGKRSSKQKQQESASNINEDISDHPSTIKQIIHYIQLIYKNYYKNRQKAFIKRQSMNDKAKLKVLNHAQSLKQKENKEGNQFDQILIQLQQLFTQNHQNQIQGNFFKDDSKNQNEINQYDIFNFFDKMKQFVKYKPRYNVTSVISRFNQLQDSKRKVVRARKHHRLSRKKNTQLSKFQKMNQENQQGDQRKHSRIIQNSSRNQNNTTPNCETFDNTNKFDNSIKKCESDEDHLKDFNFQQNDSVLNDKDDQNNSTNINNNQYQLNSNTKLFNNVDKVQNLNDYRQRQRPRIQSFEHDSYIDKHNKEEIVSDDQHSGYGIAIHILPYSFQQLSSNIPERQKLDSM